MYNLPYFKEEDQEVVLEFMRDHPFVFLTGVNEENKPVATQVPVFIDEKEGKLFLTGHIMRNTDHHKAFDQNPQAYITVLMPTAKDYASMIRYRNVPGIYVDETKSLVARERGYVMTHEFTHALHAGDTPPFSPKPAAWIAEGLERHLTGG